MKSNKLEFFLPTKYVKCNFYNPTEDDPFIGAVKYMREQGRTCEFLGFNKEYRYVVVIDGIKYYGRITGEVDMNYYATFYVVEVEEQDYRDNYYKSRADQITVFLS